LLDVSAQRAETAATKEEGPGGAATFVNSVSPGST